MPSSCQADACAMFAKIPDSLALLCAQPREPVGHVQTQLVCALDNLLALLGADVVRDLHAILLVVHQQHLEIGGLAHQELVEAVAEAVPGPLVGAVPDVGHERGALNLRRTGQSIPRGWRQVWAIFLKRSAWKRGKRFRRFFTILRLSAGVAMAPVASRLAET